MSEAEVTAVAAEPEEKISEGERREESAVEDNGVVQDEAEEPVESKEVVAAAKPEPESPEEESGEAEKVAVAATPPSPPAAAETSGNDGEGQEEANVVEESRTTHASSMDAADTSALESWYESQSQIDFVVTVEEPLEEKSRENSGSVKSRSFLSKFKRSVGVSVTTYNIKSSSPDIGAKEIRKSYSEFASLRDALRTTFPGAFIAPLPPRSVLGTKNDAFVQRRMDGLNRFIQSIAKNPYLRNDGEFIRFLSGDDVAFLSSPDRFDGAKRWGDALRAATIPWESDEETLRMVDTLGAELDAIKKALKGMLEACKKHAEVITSFSDSWRSVGSALHEWKAVETDVVTVANGTMSTEDSVILLPGVLQDIARRSFSQNIITTEHLGVEQTNRTLVDAIRFELVVAESWKEEISSIKTMLSNKSKAVATLKKARDEHEALVNAQNENSGSANPNKIVACAAKEQEALSALEVASEALFKKVKGTMVLELERYRKDRTSRMASLAGAWKSSMQCAADRMVDVWSKDHLSSPARPKNAKKFEAQ